MTALKKKTISLRDLTDGSSYTLDNATADVTHRNNTEVVNAGATHSLWGVRHLTRKYGKPLIKHDNAKVLKKR